MTPKDIIPIITQGESQTLEFKSSLKLMNEIGETISAFANTSERICERVTLEDIDEEKVKWYLFRREEIRKVKKPEELDLRTLLVNIKAASEMNGKVKLTNAGVLFFAKNPQIFILQSQLRLARFAGKELTRDFLDRTDCFGALWEVVEQAEDFIRKNIRLFGFRVVEKKLLKVRGKGRATKYIPLGD